MVKLLVEHGANINALSITETTPFMRAVESASFPCVEYLMEQGAKVNHENIQGTLRHYFSCGCYQKLFLGKTAFDIAKDFADPRVYLAVKNKFDSIPKPKDAKAKPKKKPEKKKGKEPVIKQLVSKKTGLLISVFRKNLRTHFCLR